MPLQSEILNKKICNGNFQNACLDILHFAFETNPSFAFCCSTLTFAANFKNYRKNIFILPVPDLNIPK